MGGGKSGQSGESPSASRDFEPVDRDSRSQPDYGGSPQHRNEDASRPRSGAEDAKASAEKAGGGMPDPGESDDGPTTQHTGP
jgi:hypothetical protein